jgi:hypothetical protein
MATEDQRSVVRFSWTKRLNKKDIYKGMFSSLRREVFAA